MAEAPQASTEVVGQVSDEETDRSMATPLLHVGQLMRHQGEKSTAIRFLPHPDGSAERDRLDRGGGSADRPREESDGYRVKIQARESVTQTSDIGYPEESRKSHPTTMLTKRPGTTITF